MKLTRKLNRVEGKTLKKQKRRPELIAFVGMLIVFRFYCIAMAAPTQMPTGFYFPSDRTTWTGTNGGQTGDPKQPWNDSSTGGRIFGFLEPAAPGPWYGKNHVGMDVRQAYNSPIYAVADGTIYDYFTDDNPRYYAIIVRHREASGEYFYAVYGHCRLKNGLSIGSNVTAGEIFAYVNENVNQHMHFAIKTNPDFSTGWGYLDAALDYYTIGWRPPRTWLLSHAPYVTDVIPPSITLTGPSVNVLYTSLQQISWNVTDNISGVDTVNLQWDSETPVTVAATGSLYIPNGSHTVTIRTLDKRGNSSQITRGPYLVDVPSFVVSSPSRLLTRGYFVQKADRAYGMWIDLGAVSPPDFIIGDEVAIANGTVSTANGGKTLENGSMVKVGVDAAPRPLGINTRDLTESPLATGLLVTVTGKVGYRETDGSAFYVDDDSGVTDGFHNGIRVLCTGFTDGSRLSMPDLDQFVSVTGVKWTGTVSGSVVPAVKPRWQSDIKN